MGQRAKTESICLRAETDSEKLGSSSVSVAFGPQRPRGLWWGSQDGHLDFLIAPELWSKSDHQSINQSINVSPCPRSHWGQFNRLIHLAPRKSKLLSQSRETTGKDYAILLNLSTLPESCVLCFDLIWVQGRVLLQILQVSTYKEPTKPTKGIQSSPLVQSFFQVFFLLLSLNRPVSHSMFLVSVRLCHCRCLVWSVQSDRYLGILFCYICVCSQVFLASLLCLSFCCCSVYLTVSEFNNCWFVTGILLPYHSNTTSKWMERQTDVNSEKKMLLKE